MSENAYRVVKTVLLAVLVVGVLVLGANLLRVVREVGLEKAENGRYVQLDQRKDWTAGSSSGSLVMDSRTGKLRYENPP